MFRKLWKGFVDRFIKSGMWIPALMILSAAFVWQIWDSLIVAYFVFISFGLLILYIGGRQIYWAIFKKGDYEQYKSDSDKEGTP